MPSGVGIGRLHRGDQGNSPSTRLGRVNRLVLVIVNNGKSAKAKLNSRTVLVDQGIVGIHAFRIKLRVEVNTCLTLVFDDDVSRIMSRATVLVRFFRVVDSCYADAGLSSASAPPMMVPSGYSHLELPGLDTNAAYKP